MVAAGHSDDEVDARGLLQVEASGEHNPSAGSGTWSDGERPRRELLASGVAPANSETTAPLVRDDDLRLAVPVRTNNGDFAK